MSRSDPRLNSAVMADSVGVSGISGDLTASNSLHLLHILKTPIALKLGIERPRRRHHRLSIRTHVVRKTFDSWRPFASACYEAIAENLTQGLLRHWPHLHHQLFAICSEVDSSALGRRILTNTSPGQQQILLWGCVQQRGLRKRGFVFSNRHNLSVLS